MLEASRMSAAIDARALSCNRVKEPSHKRDIHVQSCPTRRPSDTANVIFQMRTPEMTYTALSTCFPAKKMPQTAWCGHNEGAHLGCKGSVESSDRAGSLASPLPESNRTAACPGRAFCCTAAVRLVCRQLGISCPAYFQVDQW